MLNLDLHFFMKKSDRFQSERLHNHRQSRICKIVYGVLNQFTELFRDQS